MIEFEGNRRGLSEIERYRTFMVITRRSSHNASYQARPWFDEAFRVERTTRVFHLVSGRERKKGRRSWILVIGIFKMIDPDIEKNAGIFAGEALHCNKIIVKVLIQE